MAMLVRVIEHALETRYRFVTCRDLADEFRDQAPKPDATH
jgi:hypothetical protein